MESSDSYNIVELKKGKFVYFQKLKLPLLVILPFYRNFLFSLAIMTGAKRKSLTIETKVAIIEAVDEKRKTVADICKEFELAKSTVFTILKNKEKYRKVYEDGKQSTKKIRLCDRVDIDAALIKWFNQCCAASIPVSDSLLSQKAEEFGKLLDRDFKCSAGWLNRFKHRYNINSCRVSGEAKSIFYEETENWLESVWPTLRKGYTNDEIYNADETGLFFKLLPDRALELRNEKCLDGKLAKDRITVLICTNMTGTDKRKLLVIGKTKNSRYINKNRVNYQVNTKSLMTSTIFEKEIRKWDSELLKKQKKILLLVDNCPAHPRLDNLTNIKLILLPVNSTIVLKPMDLGIIRNFKWNYRKLLLKKIIIDLDMQHNITLLDAMDLLEKAWQKISCNTISNCFQHLKLSDNLIKIETVDDEEEEDIPLTELVEQWKRLNSIDDSIPVEEHIDIFMNIDNCVITSEFLSDTEIVAKVQCVKQKEVFEKQDEVKEETPKLREAIKAVKLLKCYYRSCNSSHKFVNELNAIESDLEKRFWKTRTTV